MYSFLLPDVGEGIHEAELLEWAVSVGDSVVEGDTVAVINTDKVMVELPSPVSGTVSALGWVPGDIVRVGEILMTFDREGADTASSAPEQTTSAAPTPGSSPDDLAERDSRRESRTVSESLGRPVASPSTRRLAALRGVELLSIEGTGPGGRVLRSDVDAAALAEAPISNGDVGKAPEAGAETITREPLGGVRAVVWRHMTESSKTLAATTTTFTVRMEGVEAMVRELSPTSGAEAGPRVGILAVVSSCLTVALQRHPRFNANFDAESGDLLLHRDVNLGVAVASPAGLVVPVLRGVDRLGPSDFAAALLELTARARDGLLRVEDLRGGTFSISSTGGLERARIVSTQPIINMPQVALLWMSRVRDEPVVDEGSVTAGRVMTCSLSFDHRYLDGADATRFINEVAELIEHPLRALA